MSLTEKDLEAIVLLMKQEIASAFDVRVDPFRREVNERFDHVFKELETLQQEHTVICGQLDRIETKRDDHDGRLTNLEKKVA